MVGNTATVIRRATATPRSETPTQDLVQGDLVAPGPRLHLSRKAERVLAACRILIGQPLDAPL